MYDRLKLVPSERRAIAYLSHSHWASAEQVGDGVGLTALIAAGKLRRLSSRGLVESMPGRGRRVYRLTKAGVHYKRTLPRE